MNNELALDLRNLTIVIHPGSHNLRIGRSTDNQPTKIPHCIARKCKPGYSPKKQLPFSREPIKFNSDISKIGDEIKFIRKNLGGHNSFELSPIQNVKFEDSQVSPNLSWTQPNKDFYIGDEALHLESTEKYHLSWPIRYGRFDTASTCTSTLQDLEDIWTTALENLLNTSKSNLLHYRCILIIPDIFDRRHVRETVNLLLVRMNFSAVIVQQESVCASYGIGLPSACYVDVGDQKISISCVDDGISLAESRISLSYGGSDITRLYHSLLSRIVFPVKQMNLADNFDYLLLNSLKEQNCHLDPKQLDKKVLFCQRRRPNSYISSLKIELIDENLIAPLSLFYPYLLHINSESNIVYQMPTMVESEPDDPFDDLYILLTSRERKKKDDGDNDMDDDEDDDTEMQNKSRMNSKSNKSQTGNSIGYETLSQCPSLDEAILTSINRCDSMDMKLKMCGCIIVVGSGFGFEGGQEFLSNILWNNLPWEYKSKLDSIDVITSFKDLNGGDACWKGACLITCVESTSELWLYKSEWLKFGSRVLRERAPFVWQ